MCSQVKSEPDKPHSLCLEGIKVAKSQISDLKVAISSLLFGV